MIYDLTFCVFRQVALKSAIAALAIFLTTFCQLLQQRIDELLTVNVNWLGQSLITCNLEIASINSQRDTGGKVFSLLVLDAVMLLQNANYLPSLFYSRVAINLLEQRNTSI